MNHFLLKNKIVLVTGASGFKGGWLCNTLHELGAVVYGTITNQASPGSSFSLFDLRKKIDTVHLDVTNYRDVLETINRIKPDIVYHLAAKALVPGCLRDPLRTYQVNVMGTVNLLEAFRNLKIGGRLIIVSTDHVFGSMSPDEIPEGGCAEAHPISFCGPYDTSKAVMELIVRSYCKTYPDSLPAIAITRSANVYGPGDVNDRRVVPAFIQSARREKRIHLTFRNNGRQFIHIADAIAGYVKLGQLEEIEPPDDMHAFHFAQDKYPPYQKNYLTVSELTEIIAGISSAEIDETGCIDYAPNENRVQALNVKKTGKMLNWRAGKEFIDSMAEMFRWFELVEAGNKAKQQLFLGKEVEGIIEDVG